MRIGAHVRDDDPLRAADERGRRSVQFFLCDPQSWDKPKVHPQTAALHERNLTIFIHSPYQINVASTNNRLRIPSRAAVINTRRSPPRWAPRD